MSHLYMHYALTNGIILFFVYLIGMFALVSIKKDTSLGNFTWGGGVLLVALYSYFVFSSFFIRQTVITLFIFLWCARLVFYIYIRYKKGADPRYVAWLEQYQNYAIALLFSFGWIFILNGGFALLMSLPILAVNTQTQSCLGALDLVAMLSWAVGFVCESVADYQLYVFLKDPGNKGKVCDQGLWHYSRHPNYFGEIVMWWSIYLIALGVPYGWLTFIAPCAITTSLIFVTGIPWLEKAMESNAAYQVYKVKTSMLIPWPPKE